MPKSEHYSGPQFENNELLKRAERKETDRKKILGAPQYVDPFKTEFEDSRYVVVATNFMQLLDEQELSMLAKTEIQSLLKDTSSQLKDEQVEQIAQRIIELKSSKMGVNES